MQLIWIASLFFALLIATFAVQNPAPVSVRVLFWQMEDVPVSMLTLAATALGALLTYLFGLWRGIRSRMELRHLRTRVRELEGGTTPRTPVSPPPALESLGPEQPAAASSGDSISTERRPTHRDTPD